MINSIQFYFTQFNTKISLRAILGQQGLNKKKKNKNNNNSFKLLTDFPSRKSVKNHYQRWEDYELFMVTASRTSLHHTSQMHCGQKSQAQFHGDNPNPRPFFDIARPGLIVR